MDDKLLQIRESLIGELKFGRSVGLLNLSDFSVKKLRCTFIA